MRQQRLKSSGPKPLWTCPHCSRQFANRNQAHSCGKFTVEHLLDSKPPEVVELYDRISDLVQRCGNVVIAPTKTRILFKVRTVFATVAIAKNWLDLVIVLGRRLNGIVHFLRIEKPKELDDDLAGWLQEAYDHSKRKDQTGNKKKSRH